MPTRTSWYKPFKEYSTKDGVSHPAGTSLTIPGQGSDLALIIKSIVKLPPIDERAFDVSSSDDPDTRELSLRMEMESLYRAEALNEAEAAQERQLSRKKAKELADKEKENEQSEDDADADK